MICARRQRGAAMIEFVIVGPVLTLLGLAVVQYGLLFFAKNQVNHASFMAARAGSMGHASLDSARTAYIRALVPMYGGGRTAAELGESLARATADAAAHTRIELLNPTRESFDDWNDPALQSIVGRGAGRNGADARVIPNNGLATRSLDVGTASGQSIHDANLIKLRITQGYEPKVPLVNRVYTRALQALDSGSDSFHTALIAGGRIPVVSHVTLQMQSDAIEPANPVSSPGPGNNGTPTDPHPTVPSGPSPAPDAGPGDPPQTPVDPGGKPRPPLPCPEGRTVIETASADVLFDFDSATLNEAGLQALDAVIEQARHQTFDSLRLTGYTDPLGSAAHNDRLSRNRAAAVREYLVRHGFPDRPITVEGRGSQDLVRTVAQCPSGPGQIACLAPNRRVVFTFEGVR